MRYTTQHLVCWLLAGFFWLTMGAEVVQGAPRTHKTVAASKAQQRKPKPRRHSTRKRAKKITATTKPLPSALTREGEAKARYDQPREAAQYFRLKRLPQGTKELPIAQYLRAKTQMEAMPQYSIAAQRVLPSRQELRRAAASERALMEGLSAWTPLGPGNVGGRTRALLIHPTRPEIMYAAGVAGGVWRTINGGQHWEPLTDLLANLAVSSLAFDPKNPAVIYAGTGEGFFNGDALQGAGIFRTRDGGDTWEHLAATLTKDFHYVNDLIVSPTNSQTIYAGTDTGVWRSTDGGNSWTQSQAARREEIGGCMDLAMRTDQMQDVLFAAFGIIERGAIYRNLNAGDSGTWEEVVVRENMYRTALAIAPSDQNIIYAVAWGRSVFEGNGLHAVLRSTQGGSADSWTVQVEGTDSNPLNRRILSNPIYAFLGECGYGRSQVFNQAWYNLTIAVDPLDANRVWVGGTDLFRSDDSGKNWGQASHWWAEKEVPQYSHADHHRIVFHPNYNGTTNKTMFVGNDGGLFRTDDARAPVATGPLAVCNPLNSKVTWTALNNNYGVTQFYFGLPFPDGKSYLGGTQDNGTVLGTDAMGVNGWREINGGDGGYVAVDHQNPNILYAEYTGLSIRKSTDGGATFSYAMNGFEYFLGGDSSLFITPFLMDPSNPRILYTGGLVTWRTMNAGAYWEVVGDSVGTNNGQVSALAVAPTDSNYLLVGKSTGLVHRTQRALAIRSGPPMPFNPDPYWQHTILSPHQGGFVSSLAFDPKDKNIAYATISTFGIKHVWQSIDAGATWTPIDGEGATGLPDLPAHSIAVDPSNSARLFVGTDLGVFASTDGGASWAVENNGFANTIVESLSINTVQGVSHLFAFTHGRGAWRVPLGTNSCETPKFAPVQTCDANGGTYTIPITSTATSCQVTATSNADWIQILSATNTEVRYQVAAQTKYETRNGTVTIAGRSHQVNQVAPVDTTPPTVTITSPASGTVTTSARIRVTFSLADNDKVSFLSYGRDCLPNQIFPTTNPPPNVEFYFGLEPGVNTFCVQASDPAGHRSSASIQIIFVPEYFSTSVGGAPFAQKYAGDGGAAQQASFSNPPALTLDGAGNIFIADQGNGRIRRIDARTNIVTTVAGKGYEDGAASRGDGGPALDAVLEFPQDVKVDRAGNIYILQRGRIRKVTPDGIINTVVGDGERGYRGDGDLGTRARFGEGYQIALDASGNLYYADTNNQRIRKLDAQTGIITTIVGTGRAGFSGDGGVATQAEIRFPNAVAFDRAGNLYFTDSGNSRVRKVQRDSGIISTIAGNGESGPCETPTIAEEVPALTASLGSVFWIGLDAADNIYVTTQCRMRRIGTDGKIKSIAGYGGYYASLVDDVPALLTGAGTAQAINAAGEIYFTDSWSSTIRKHYPVSLKNDPVTVSIAAPAATGNYATSQRQIEMTGTANGVGTVVRVRWRNDRGGAGVASGTKTWTIPEIALYSGLNRITVTAETVMGVAGSATITVKVNPAYVAHRLAGLGVQVNGFGGDGGRALQARFWAPMSVAVDNAGAVYIADRLNYRIRKVATDGTISTYAGTGEVGSSGDSGPANQAEFNQPSGVACDAAGNLFIADTLNHRIRKVTTAGIISTIAGTGRQDFGGDGGLATSAWLDSPSGLIVDSQGNLIFADTGNNRIRKIDARTGLITTVVGNGNPRFAGEGVAATEASLKLPSDVAVDRNGNLFIADRGNKRVRKVSANGIITTMLDESATNTSDQGPFPLLSSYAGLEVDAAGNLYVTNELSPFITKVAPNGETSVIAGSPGGYTLYDGSPATGIQLWRPGGIAIDRVGNLYVADQYANNVWLVSPYLETASVNGASYAPNAAVGVESIVSIFGSNLATREAAAQQLPLPVELGGTSIKVRDSVGVERLAPLFYVSKLQVNYQIPVGTAPGFATVIVTTANGEVSAGAVNVTNHAPGLFSATANGSGWAAASVLYVKGTQRWSSPVASCTAQGCTPILIDLSAADEVYLELYGTGIRANRELGTVRAMIGGETATVLYAGPQCCYAGLDQVNVQLPTSLRGRGTVEVVLSLDEKTANPVRLNVK